MSHTTQPLPQTHQPPERQRPARSEAQSTSRIEAFRRMVEVDCRGPEGVVLGIARTQEDLVGCFRLLHDCYVDSGFMVPHPSGMRLTPYHSLPTTTTLFAKIDGEVVGTVSIIREGVLGFPMQREFDLDEVRSIGGQIAEISALAVHPKIRGLNGKGFFPLMKFLYEYCVNFFDVRHLVIAVNPNMIEFYEHVLIFQKLKASQVAHYDFANGAPAVGATLDLRRLPEMYGIVYGHRPEHKNLHHYFTLAVFPQIETPVRPYFVTNDGVMTPHLLDHFFNRESRVLDQMTPRQVMLMHEIYDLEAYAGVLPASAAYEIAGRARRHPRHSLKCPSTLHGESHLRCVDVVEISRNGLAAHSAHPLPMPLHCQIEVQLGSEIVSRCTARIVRQEEAGLGWRVGLALTETDGAWQAACDALDSGLTTMALATPS